MFTFFSTMSRERDAGALPAWARDPLAHPDIAAMDSRALGDLPFGLFRAAPPGPAEDGVSPPSAPRTGPCA